MRSEFDIPKLSLDTLCELLKSEKLSLEDYILDSLELIDTKEDTIQALLPEPDRKERLLQDAKLLAQRYPEPSTRPPLYGVLLGVKDLFNVDGMPTQAGSRIPASAFTGQEADLVSRFKDLGVLVLGKTVSTEFAYFSPGPTCNPINPEYSPGGSSSGSAAAIAAGYCHLAIGTQTIASVIRPASYCGIYGYKPTKALLSMYGVFPFSGSGDAAGLFSQRLHHISTTAKLLGIASQSKAIDIKQDTTFAIVSGDFLQQADKSVQDNFEKVLAKLSDKGYRLEKVDLFPDLETVIQDYQGLIAAEFARNHLALFKQYAHLYSPHSLQLFEKGIGISDKQLRHLKCCQIDLGMQIHATLKRLNCQIILSPSTTSTAPLGQKSTGSPLMSLPFTAAGMPSVTIPSGYDEQNMDEATSYELQATSYELQATSYKPFPSFQRRLESSNIMKCNNINMWIPAFAGMTVLRQTAKPSNRQTSKASKRQLTISPPYHLATSPSRHLANLPFGLQVIAPQNKDSYLLSVADELDLVMKE